jgi:hypothetical protein
MTSRHLDHAAGDAMSGATAARVVSPANRALVDAKLYRVTADRYLTHATGQDIDIVAIVGWAMPQW